MVSTAPVDLSAADAALIERDGPAAAFGPLFLPRHGRRPLAVIGAVVARVDTRDDADAPYWHEIDLIMTRERAIAVSVRGRWRGESGDGPLRRCDLAALAQDAAEARAALSAYDPAPLAPIPADFDTGAAWEAYLEIIEALRADAERARARLSDVSAV